MVLLSAQLQHCWSGWCADKHEIKWLKGYKSTCPCMHLRNDAVELLTHSTVVQCGYKSKWEVILPWTITVHSMQGRKRKVFNSSGTDLEIGKQALRSSGKAFQSGGAAWGKLLSSQTPSEMCVGSGGPKYSWRRPGLRVRKDSRSLISAGEMSFRAFYVKPASHSRPIIGLLYEMLMHVTVVLSTLDYSPGLTARQWHASQLSDRPRQKGKA